MPSLVCLKPHSPLPNYAQTLNSVQDFVDCSAVYVLNGGLSTALPITACQNNIIGHVPNICT